MKRDNSARRLLRLKPASEYLSVSPATLRALCQRGEIPVIRVTENGHAPWLLDRLELDSWIERSKIRLD
jgi:excisionase family DNA binding protein